MVRMARQVAAGLMPMSVTGSKQTVGLNCQGVISQRGHQWRHQRGFTLIEILLVLVIIVVLSAMIAPSFFSALGSDVDSEARQLHLHLKMLADEASLSGKPIRCAVFTESMECLTPGQGQWMPMSGILASYHLSPGIQVSMALLDDTQGVQNALDAIDQVWQERQGADQAFSDKPRDQPDGGLPIAEFVFWPDGSVTNGSIEISASDDQKVRRIRLQSGLGGIRLEEAEQ